MEANQIHENEIDLTEIFFVLLKKIWLILLVGILLAAGAGFYTKKYITPQYQSTSMLYVLGKSTSITSLADIQLGTQLTSDYVIMIKSRPVVNEVIENMNLDLTYEQMVKKIAVNNPSNTRIIKITVTDPDPFMARDIATEFVNVSKKKMAEIMVTDEPTVVEEGSLNETPVSPSPVSYTHLNLKKSIDKMFKILYDINVPIDRCRKRRGSGGIGRRAGFRCLW